MKVSIIIAVLLSSAQAHAGIVQCAFDAKCEGIRPCEASDLKLSFTTVEMKPEVPDDPLRVPQHIKPKFVTVWGLNEEFEAFPIGTSSDDIIGFWGHLRIAERILDPGYFWGSRGEQHILTLANGVARYSIHQPLQNRATYLQGTCNRER